MDVQCADWWITDCEVLGKFDIGCRLDNAYAHVRGNNFDQCNTGALDVSNFAQWIGNRFQFCYQVGLQLGITVGDDICRGPQVVSNRFWRNNSTKTLGYSTDFNQFDGTGLRVENCLNPMVAQNYCWASAVGIKWLKGSQGTAADNNFRDLKNDNVLDTTEAGNSFEVQDRNRLQSWSAGAIRSSLALSGNYVAVTGAISSTKPPRTGVESFNSVSASFSHDITSSNMLIVRMTTAGQTVTITNTSDFLARGVLLAVINDNRGGSTNDFTLANADGAIYGNTTVASGKRRLYMPDISGNLIELAV